MARPPALARLLLRLLPRRHREFIVGDLEEEYTTAVRPGRSRWAADLWFWRQTVSSLLVTARHDPMALAMPTTLQDLVHALRSFRSGRSALLLAAVVLALAIGAGTVTYSVVSGVVLRSLPFTEPDRLVMVRVAPRAYRTRGAGGATMSWETVDLVMRTEGAFESTAYYYGSGQPVLTGVGEPERLTAFTVGPGFFAVLGTPALLGRVLVDGDMAAGEAPAAVLSHRFWRTRLGGDPTVIGRTLRVGDRLHEVVGVMPPGFAVPTDTDLWIPEGEPGLGRFVGGHVQGAYWLIGRLAPGVSREDAMARTDPRFAAHAREYPDFEEWGANLEGLHDRVVGEVRGPLLMLLGAVALVLLIACANVATVLLARGVARRREVAVRLSLGAGRLRVVRQLIAEAVLLALGGGAVGIALASWGVSSSVRLAGAELPRAGEIGLDWRIAGVAVAVSLLTGLLTGALPAFLAIRESLSGALKDGGMGSGTSSWRSRIGEALVVLQVALGTILLAGAALLVLTFLNLTRVELGFEPARVVVADFTLPAERYGSPDARELFLSRVLETARALPGVEAVAAGTGTPFDGGAVGSIELADRPTPEGAPWAWITHVTPAFFQVLGLPVVRGRWLPAAGTEGLGYVVVNDAFATAYFPGADPVGQEIVYYGARRGRIVGVVGDARQEALNEPPPPQIYTPMASVGRHLKVVARSAATGGAGPGALRGVIRSLDPLLPIDRVGTLEDLASEMVARERFYAVILWSFAALALLMAALGVYGVTAYAVSRRTPEIGIRMALGASGGRIRALTLGHAAVLGALGILLGLAGAAAASRLLEALLFGVSPTDPVLLGVVALSLAAVSLAAAWPSARRASRLEPMRVLRAQ